MNNKEVFLEKIRNNIEKDNFHITVVQSSEVPRFAYTIGNIEKLEFELVLAGNLNFLYEDVLLIFNSIVPNLTKDFNYKEFSIDLGEMGIFKLSEVDSSWSKLMMLGVYDYYNIDDFKAYQIMPDQNHKSLDIPNMSNTWNNENIIWKWLDDTVKWNLDVPQNSRVITELKVLFGEKVTEVTRWEDDEWEAFSQNGDDVDKDDVRFIPISTLLGIDNSTQAILKLNVEDGLRRESGDSDWNEW